MPTTHHMVLLRHTAQVFPSGNVYPSPEATVPWLAELPTPLTTPCTDAVVQAVEALLQLSSLAYLDKHRDVDSTVELAAEDAARQFSRAMQQLRLLRQDQVVDEIIAELDQMADRVQKELDNTGSGSFAASLALPAGEDSDLHTVQVLLIAATQHDVDMAASVTP